MFSLYLSRPARSPIVIIARGIAPGRVRTTMTDNDDDDNDDGVAQESP